MKRMISLILTVVSVMCLFLTCTISGGAVDKTGPEVRVNGKIVEFPDIQPYINDDLRTMIPVRGVTEALGADVSYDKVQRAAIVEKDGTKLTIPIGSKEMTVEKDGEKSIVTMDTEAVLIDNARTMVPIRFVAETLGAWVSFSSAYNTVQIYDDVLTPNEITALHALDNHWEVCDARKPLLQGRFGYENLNECCIRDFTSAIDYTITNVYTGDTYTNGKDPVEDETLLLADYICGAFSERYSNKYSGATATFRTDISCLAATTAGTGNTYINRGYLTIKFANNADIAKYKKTLNTCDFGNIKAGETYTFALESIWMMNIASGRPTCMGVYDVTDGTYNSWR